MDVCEASGPAKAALYVAAVSIATMHARVTRGVPEVRDQRLVVKGTMRLPSVHGSLGAGDAREGVVAAEAALRLDAIRPAADLSELAPRVPIIRDVRLVLKAATRGRARDVRVCPTTAKAALNMLAVGIA